VGQPVGENVGGDPFLREPEQISIVPAIAEHDVSDDDQAPVVSQHLERQIDWTAGPPCFLHPVAVPIPEVNTTCILQGTQQTRLGSDIESRFWLSYRPYESKNVAREWFVGPVLTWLHSQDDRIAGVGQGGSGGDLLLAGATTYVRPGMHVWLGMDWDVAHTTGASFMPVRRHISFGVTQQFRLHF
jgi:hypothetical protein